MTADSVAPTGEERPDKGSRFVLQPEEGRAYWQPRPANGYAVVKVKPGQLCLEVSHDGDSGGGCRWLLRARALALAQ